MLEWTEKESFHVGVMNCGLQFVIRKWLGSQSYTITVATDSGKVLAWHTDFPSVAKAKEFAVGVAKTKEGQ